MGFVMPRAKLVLIAVLGAAIVGCGPQKAADPRLDLSVSADQTWFVCDGEGQSLTASIANASSEFLLSVFDEKSGAFTARRTLLLGAPIPADEATTTPLSENGAEVGALRVRTAGEGDWTVPVISVALDGRELACAHRPKTRLIAFDANRTMVAYRDEAGLLILETRQHDGRKPALPAILRGGSEEAGRNSLTLSFDQGPDRYILNGGYLGDFKLLHWRSGELLSNEPLFARAIGDDPDVAASPLRTGPPSP